LHGTTREPGKAPVPAPVVAQLIARTLCAPPCETTHWTSRATRDYRLRYVTLNASR
jgi:hypothetical protein